MRIYIVFEADYPDIDDIRVAVEQGDADVSTLDAPDTWTFDGIYGPDEIPTWARRGRKAQR